MVRGGTAMGLAGKAVNAANRWRENYNPLRGLKMADAAAQLEMAQRGDTALCQWTFRFVERRWATLAALISRCEAPLLTFDWEVRVRQEMPMVSDRQIAKWAAEFPAAEIRNDEDRMTNDERNPKPESEPAKAGTPNPDAKRERERLLVAAAGRQQETLRAAYERIDNLKDAVRHLHLAEFRGYAHLQKHRDEDGCVVHLEPLDQWCVCRDGLYGDWFWNPDSMFVVNPGAYLGEANRIGGEVLPREDFIIGEAQRPIDEVALINFLRANMCEKDWDGFVEIYGIPGGVVTMPGNVPQGREAEYEDAARKVAEGGTGAIPNGATYTANDGPRGVDPFSPRLKHLEEQVILAGTGGKLTMLAESGSGTLAGGAHADTFEAIAEGRAQKISERFQRDFDAEVIARAHPGEPVLVYFKFGVADSDAPEVAGFKREIIKSLATHEMLSRVLANQTDLKETVRGAGLPVNEDYTDPYLPVVDNQGNGITGKLQTDAQGNVIGAKPEIESGSERVSDSETGRRGSDAKDAAEKAQK